MRRTLVQFLPVLLLLAACSPAAPGSESRPQAQAVATAQIAPTPTDDPSLIPTLFPSTTPGGDLTRTDEQGMVVVEVTPTNLGMPADTLEFEVAMNTHSVNLSMDLASLSMLATDTGLTIQAAKWDAPPGGGHHVSGKLIFPSTQNGKSILEGARKLTLTILDVDAPSRVFEWELK